MYILLVTKANGESYIVFNGHPTLEIAKQDAECYVKQAVIAKVAIYRVAVGCCKLVSYAAHAGIVWTNVDV